jgi:hypothetical protein
MERSDDLLSTMQSASVAQDHDFTRPNEFVGTNMHAPDAVECFGPW